MICLKKYIYSPEELAVIEQSVVPYAVFQMVDRRIKVCALSAGFMDLFRVTDREETIHLMEHDLYVWDHPDDRVRIAEAALFFATEDEPYNIIYRVLIGDEYRMVHAIGKHITQPDGTQLAVVWYTDEGQYDPQTEHSTGKWSRALDSALHESSFYRRMSYDVLTGLPNLSYFLELAEAEKERSRKAGKEPAMLFTDFSGLKAFNQRYGYEEGDRLLQAFAKVLKNHFESECCSRIAQDHFSVITVTEDLEPKLKAILAETENINGGKTLPLRIGIYRGSIGMVGAATACDRAKIACDKGRSDYRSRYIWFDADMLEETERNAYIIDHLDQAIREKWITVYYQPIIRAANGKVCEEEALARWIDPERGFLSPADFIPVLEDARLIRKLDLFVLDRIIEKMKQMQEAGLYIVPHSLNLSRMDFDGCDMVEEIRNRMDSAGVSRDKLTIEITESAIGTDFDFMKTQVARFREMGFKVWMDDFGSGYSSLDLLQSIKFDLIKFDMSFMRRFNEGEETRIILTQLIKMAIGLGFDTVAEGVETKEQVDFLTEVGCSCLQGYYYSKPIPAEEILERYRKGTQIGFENPQEADYYASIGRINLYDLTAIAQGSNESLQHFFDTAPMAIIETNRDEFRITRCNKAYRDYLTKMFGGARIGQVIPYDIPGGKHDGEFLYNIRKCGEDGNVVLIDEKTSDNETTHALIRRIAVNPVTGMAAVAVAVLAVLNREDSRNPVSYAHIAKALSADYRKMYYVDLDTEQYTEYSSDPLHKDLSVERHGEDFFRTSRESAEKMLYEPDREAFVRAFTRENVLRRMETQGAFSITYRLLEDGRPKYMNMKGVQISAADRHIIFGVSDVDIQHRQEETLERLKAEQKAFARVAALSGNYMCIYSVNPETDEYVEYNAASDYERLGLPKEGKDFFGTSIRESRQILYPEDREMFEEVFRKERILQDIREKQQFTASYRLIMNGETARMYLKAIMIPEEDGESLVVGIRKEQVRK